MATERREILRLSEECEHIGGQIHQHHFKEIRFEKEAPYNFAAKEDYDATNTSRSTSIG